MTDEIDCWCFECRRDIPVADMRASANTLPGLQRSWFTEGNTRMFLCPECGNKRCPRATDHREPCSGSNDAGQLGSRYGIYPNPNRRLFDFVEGLDPEVD
jgi:hypothetical protein